jgi:hypothetical protein
MKWALLGAVAAVGIFLLWQRRSNAGTVALSGGLGQNYGKPPTLGYSTGSGLPPSSLPPVETYVPPPSTRPNVAQTVGCAGGAVGGAGAATYFGAPQLAPLAGTIGCQLGSKIGGLAAQGGAKIGSGVSTVLQKLKFW